MKIKGFYDSGRFEFKFTYDTDKINHCKSLGLTYDAHRKLWHTSDATIACLLDPTLAKEKKVAYKPFMGGGYNFIASYQEEGSQALLDNERFLLADGMGLGKSAQTIAALNGLKAKKILILCPASLTTNWRNEIRKFGSEDLNSLPIAINKDAAITIASYTSAPRKLTENRFDVVVMDEAHYIKNPKTIRSKYVLGGKSGKKSYPGLLAKRFWLLTGTPIAARPKDIFNLLQIIDPNNLGKSWFGFMKRYAALKRTRWGWDYSGYSHLDELAKKLGGKYLRRTKDDVLDLPEKIRSFVELESDSKVKRLISKSLQMSKTATGRQYIDQEGKYDFAEIAKIRKEVGLSKVTAISSSVIDAVDSGEKVILFAHHVDVVNAYMEAFAAENIHAVKYVGGMTQSQKDKSVDAFQNGGAKIFIGNLSAASVGITLTAASHIVFGEIDWTPSTLFQAEDRAYRIGQKNCVNVYYYIYKGSLDEQMLNSVFRKEYVVNKVIK